MSIPFVYESRPISMETRETFESAVFLDTFVHDLGNLVQIAASAINIVSREPGVAASATLDRAMADARVSLDRAGELIRRSLSERRSEAVGEDVDVTDSLSALKPLLERMCGPAIRLEVRAARLPRIAGYRIDFENAVLNLALNACDAMPAGGVLTITADVADGPEIPEIELVVSDNGIGMAPELLAVATEPHFTTKPDGRGMGLASVARFVAGASGRLSINSTPARGTAVTMRLPAEGTWHFG
jgi:signal transduction histidine kinase